VSPAVEQLPGVSVAAESITAPRVAAAHPREYGLDWLRVIAFVILIGYHSGMYFLPWPWMVKNPQSYNWLTWVMIFFNRWRLPLLFFISGAGTWFNLQRRSPGEFSQERIRRLLLPLAFGMFVIVPPQIYVERLLAGRHYASYFDFWRTVFTLVPYPQGNLSFIISGSYPTSSLTRLRDCPSLSFSALVPAAPSWTVSLASVSAALSFI
jgi:acyltransferase-like protein